MVLIALKKLVSFVHNRSRRKTVPVDSANLAEEETRKSLQLGMLRLGKTSKFHVFLDAYGRFIARHPWYFLVIPITVSVTFASGLTFYRMNNDISYLYTPTDSPSRHEIEVYNTFHLPSAEAKRLRASGEAFQGVKIDAGTGDFAIAIIYEALSDDQNFLRNPQLIYDFDDFVKHQLLYSYDNSEFRFNEVLCPDLAMRCNDSLSNFRKFMEIFVEFQGWLKFTYPIFEGILGQKYNIANMFHGVKFMPNTNIIRSVSVVTTYISINETLHKDMIGHWKNFKAQLIEEVKVRNELNPTLRIHVFSPEMLNQEVDKIQAHTLPYVALTFTIIFLFAILSNLDRRDGWVGSNSWEAVGGIAASLLSLPPTFGILFMAGAIFNGSVTMTPFLILAIGIDDTFIMLGAWRKTYGCGKIEERLGEVMREVGAAIFLTSITDVASFSIGALSTTTPAMVAFCQFTAVGIALDFLLQITFFPALLVFGGKREERGYHGLWLWKKVKKYSDSPYGSSQSKLSVESTGSSNYGYRACSLFLQFLRSRLGKFWAITGYVVYLSIAVYGTTRGIVDLKVDKLLSDDSTLSSYLKLMNTVVWAESVRAEVFVEKPPDFRNAEFEERFLNFTEKLESTPFSVGPDSTTFWLKDYVEFRKNSNFPSKKYYSGLQNFVKTQENLEEHEKVIYWKRNSSIFGNKTLDKFKFDVYFSNLTTWSDRISLLRVLRNAYGDMKEFEVTIHTPNSFSSDQVAKLAQSTMQTIGIALLVMGAIALLFFPSLEGMFWVFLALLSIDVGVVGFLFLWGADLDPMTMTNIVLSIGFSIDFSAHFCFQFYRLRPVILEKYSSKRRSKSGHDSFQDRMTQSPKSPTPTIDSDYLRNGSPEKLRTLFHMNGSPPSKSPPLISESMYVTVTGSGVDTAEKQLTSNENTPEQTPPKETTRLRKGSRIIFPEELSNGAIKTDFETSTVLDQLGLEDVDVGTEVLATIGWPIFQCGLSTILAVLPLALVPAYLVRTFFKTVFLAVGFGLMHALVLLPTILSSLCVNNAARAREVMRNE